MSRLRTPTNYSRYRTPTICNVFLENKMAYGSIKHTDTRDSVDASCFYSHIGPSFSVKVQFRSNTLYTYVYLIILRKNKNWLRMPCKSFELNALFVHCTHTEKFQTLTAQFFR